MESASRTIRDLSDRLTVDGFKEWYEKRQKKNLTFLSFLYITLFVTIQYLHSYVQKSIPDQLR